MTFIIKKYTNLLNVCAERADLFQYTPPPPPHTHTIFSVVQVDKQKEIHLHHITQPILFIYERYLENDEKVV